MKSRELRLLDRELKAFLATMTGGMGRPERCAAMGHYVTGLLLDGERKSVQPMAARLESDPTKVDAMRQRLTDCVGVSSWSDAEVLRRLAQKLDAELPKIEAFVLDDTGFPKKGKHSVGVARQYSGTLGRTDNCQVATSLHLAGESGSACVGMRLYLPEEWTSDPARCTKAGVPESIEFKKKWEIALELLDAAIEWGVRKHVVLGDAGYGDSTDFRRGLDDRGLSYLLGVQGTQVVWAPGTGPKPPPPRKPGQIGRPRTAYRDGRRSPVAIEKLALGLGRPAYRKVTWRSGSRGKQSSDFAAVRVRTAHRHVQGDPPGAEQWLLCEWPKNEPKPKKFYLSTLPPNASLRRLVRFAKLRWRVERDYQEMKQEVGLDHFEGRTWRGFHHHVTLCAVAHGFLSLRRALFPSGQSIEMDAADSATSPPADSAAPDRMVSALQPPC